MYNQRTAKIRPYFSDSNDQINPQIISYYGFNIYIILDFSGGSSSKEPPASSGGIRDSVSFPGLAQGLGGNDNVNQYSSLENPWTAEPGGAHPVA